MACEAYVFLSPWFQNGVKKPGKKNNITARMRLFYLYFIFKNEGRFTVL